MNKEIITNKQGISIIVLFIIGSAIVLSPGGATKQDVWITILISILMAVPIVFIYARILQIFPQMDLFQILEELYGTVISKIIAVLLVWYAFHLGALVLRNFSEFITTVSLPETPQVVIIASIIVVCIWLVKCGIETMGRWTGILFPLLIIAILAQIILSMTQADFNNLKPVLYNGIQPLIIGSYADFPFLSPKQLYLLWYFAQKEINSIHTKYITLGCLLGVQY